MQLPALYQLIPLFLLILLYMLDFFLDFLLYSIDISDNLVRFSYFVEIIIQYLTLLLPLIIPIHDIMPQRILLSILLHLILR